MLKIVRYSIVNKLAKQVPSLLGKLVNILNPDAKRGVFIVWPLSVSVCLFICVPACSTVFLNG